MRSFLARTGTGQRTVSQGSQASQWPQAGGFDVGMYVGISNFLLSGLLQDTKGRIQLILYN